MRSTGRAHPQRNVRCAIIRGGTSRGVYFARTDLPRDPIALRALLLSAMGSPDPRQIDGLGGADPLTSKVAIVAPSRRPGVDLDYEAWQIAIAERLASNHVMCGNLASGLPYFAMTRGWVISEPPVSLTIHCENNGKRIIATLPDAPGSSEISIAGVPGTAPRVRLSFLEPGGTLLGDALPLGAARIPVELSDRTASVSVVDAGAVYAFVQAETLGATGTESAETLDQMLRLRSHVDAIRRFVAGELATKCGSQVSPSAVKVALVGPQVDVDIASTLAVSARIVNPERSHKAFAVGGAVALATAATIHGTVVSERVGTVVDRAVVRICHPSGEMDVTLAPPISATGGPSSICLDRTARLIMSGTVQV